MSSTPSFPNTDEPGFDLEKAKKYARDYSMATGSNCIIIDSKGKTIYQSSCNFCGFCGKGRLNCSDVHLYGSYQAERFGGRYVFFCPYGLTHWASPISSGKQFLGAMIGGPVLMVEPDEFMIDDFTATHIPGGISASAEQIKKIPVKNTEIVNSMSELLFVLACNVLGGSEGQYEERVRFGRVQAEIAQAVQALKAGSSSEEETLSYPFEKERELLSAISLGDKSTSQRILNEILGVVFFASGKDFRVMKARTMELTVLLSRAAIEGGANSAEIFGLNYGYLSEIEEIRTVEELTFWLSKILARFNDCVFNLVDVRHKDIIYKAADYIKKNYMRKITLEEVSGSVYLNPSYFSKIFKSEMGCSFVNYVNRVRVEMSKNLLFDLSVPLTDVSSLAGFDEQCYFTRVFKKLTGMTPGAFRKSMGRQITKEN